MRPTRPGSPGQRPRRSVLVLLVLAALTVATLDVRGGTDSPIEPLRSAVGDVLGPLERGTSAALRPVLAVPQLFQTSRGLRERVAELEAENARLRGELATSTHVRNRAAQLDGLLSGARGTGHAVVPAQVVAMGPAQTFTRTVTIDAGTTSGVGPDMTVINNDGLVGRVLRADRSTATVLLLVDQDSVVGGRLGSTMEIGFLRGRGERGEDARLELDLADRSVTPARDDVVVTWGSRSGAPYVAGVPIGQVTSVHSTPSQLSAQAEIKPFVDFTALDLVGVVVDPDTRGDRPLLNAGARQEASR